MYWSAEELVLVATGALFLVIVGSSFLPRFQLTHTSRIAFAIGAVVFIGSAVTLARIEVVRYPPPVWLLPLVPIIIMGVLVRDAIAWRVDATPVPVGFSSPTANADAPRRAAFFPPADHSLTAGEGGDGAQRELASSANASPQQLAELAFTRPQLRAAVAANPATPANVLEWLASQGDPVVHAAIAARTSPVEV